MFRIMYYCVLLLLYGHLTDAKQSLKKRHRRDSGPTAANTLPDIVSMTAFQNGARIPCPDSTIHGALGGFIPTRQPAMVSGQTPTAQQGLVAGNVPTAVPGLVQPSTARPGMPIPMGTPAPGLPGGSGSSNAYGPTARMVQPSAHQLRQMFESKGGHYIPEYMATTQEEATANFQNILTLTTPSQAPGPNSSISAYDNDIAKATLLEDLEKLHFYLLHSGGGGPGVAMTVVNGSTTTDGGDAKTPGVATPPLPTVGKTSEMVTPPVPVDVTTPGIPTPPMPTHTTGHGTVGTRKTTTSGPYNSTLLPSKTLNTHEPYGTNTVSLNETTNKVSNGTKVDVDKQGTGSDGETNVTLSMSNHSPGRTVRSDTPTTTSTKQRPSTPSGTGTESRTMPTTSTSTTTIDPAVLSGLEALDKYVHGRTVRSGTPTTTSTKQRPSTPSGTGTESRTMPTTSTSTTTIDPAVLSGLEALDKYVHGRTVRSDTPTTTSTKQRPSTPSGTGTESRTMPTTSISTTTIDPAVLSGLEALDKYVHGVVTGVSHLTLTKPDSTGNESGVSTESETILNRTSDVTRVKRDSGRAPSMPVDLDRVWREAGTVIHPEALLGLTRGNRRQKRNADDSFTQENYCQMKGSRTADGQFLHMCSTCAVTTQLSADYFPRYINEALCKSSDGTCMVVGPTAHGACKQRTFTLNILRKQHNSCLMVNHSNKTYIMEDWQLHPKQIRVSCECTINKNSVFRQYVSANIPSK